MGKPELVARLKERDAKKAARIHAAEVGLEAEYTAQREERAALLKTRTANNHVPGGKNFTGMGYNIINGAGVAQPVAKEGNNYVRKTCYETIQHQRMRRTASNNGSTAGSC